MRTNCKARVIPYRTKNGYSKPLQNKMALPICAGTPTTAIPARTLLGLDSDTFYISDVAAVFCDSLRPLRVGITLSNEALMDCDFPGVSFPILFMYQNTVDKLMDAFIEQFL